MQGSGFGALRTRVGFLSRAPLRVVKGYSRSQGMILVSILAAKLGCYVGSCFRVVLGFRVEGFRGLRLRI